MQARQSTGIREARRITALLRRPGLAMVILFGSQASGASTAESDIDLCVLLDSYEGLPRFRIKQDLYRRLMEQHYAFPVDVDFHVYTVKDFQDRLLRNDPLVRDITAGKVLYERR